MMVQMGIGCHRGGGGDHFDGDREVLLLMVVMVDITMVMVVITMVMITMIMMKTTTMAMVQM